MRTAALRRWLGAATITGALLLAAVPNLASAATQPSTTQPSTTQPSTTATITPYVHGIAVSPGTGSSEPFNLRVGVGSGLSEVDNLKVTCSGERAHNGVDRHSPTARSITASASSTGTRYRSGTTKPG